MIGAALVMGLWWLMTPAQAATVTKTGDICVYIATQFLDLAGDNWTTHADKSARGVRYEITDDAGTHSGFLDGSTGCLDDHEVQVEQSNGTFELKVISRAQVNGVDIKSWRGPDTDTKPLQAVVWPNVPTGTGTTFGPVDKVISNLDQRWINLAVAAYVFRNTDWNVDEPNGADCCLEDAPGYVASGTCDDPATGGYELLTTPIELQADTDTPTTSKCCGSSMELPGGAMGPPGLHTGTNVHWKFMIAHEIGHVIAGMRLGGKEAYNGANSPHDACVGDAAYNVGSGEWEALDYTTRGEFTKENMALALREGWGNFVSAVTFNSRAETTCEFQVQYNRHDFDLDGDLDSNRSGTDMDGAYDCESHPDLPGDAALPTRRTGWTSSRAPPTASVPLMSGTAFETPATPPRRTARPSTMSRGCCGI